MDFIVFDLELNSKAYKSDIPNEIIEIGAVKLDENFEEIDRFQVFIRPRVHRKLFPIIRRKTNIKQQDINDALSFRQVIGSFKKWVGKNYIFCTWGIDDIHNLKLNCVFNHSSIKWIKSYIDIQKHFSKLYNSPAGQRFSLEKAIATLEIPIDQELHRADVDAHYTAEIFRRIYDRIQDQIKMEM